VLYGALRIAAPAFALSTLNWTLATATLSVALAVMLVVPEIVALLAGDVIATTGGVVSGVVTVKATPLLGMPGSVSTTLPVVAPLGTGTTTRVVLQLDGVPAVPLNETVPTAVPKFVPVIVTNVPTDPEAGLRPVIFGLVTPPAPALNPAKTAPQASDAASEACADSIPDVVCTCCSANSFVPGSCGTLSRIENPLPAEKTAGLAVEIAPRNKSPPDAADALPLFGDAPLPWAMAITSSEFEVATPEYSTIAKRIVADAVSDTVMVFAPPAMFSA
jgi:hypothetical protein